MAKLMHTHTGECLLCIMQTGESDNVEKTTCELLRLGTITNDINFSRPYPRPYPHPHKQNIKDKNQIFVKTSLFMVHSKL